jgi:hypothetical protein
MRALAIATAASLAIGCVASDSTSSTSQAVTAWNRLAANRLAANRLAANRLAANRLAANRLAANQLSVNQIAAGDLLSTPDGRDVMSYVVSCALPANETLVATSSTACSTDTDCADLPLEAGNTTFSGACSASHTCTHTCTYSFSGVVGVAPQWADDKLDQAGRRWVSACLFSRVNGHDTSEEISLRGENDALTVAPDEQLLFNLEEGAFWGDLFRGTDKPILWVACSGRDNVGSVSGGLTIRECARPDPAHPGFTMCGFYYAGNCGDYNPVLNATHACQAFESEKDHASFYDGCHVSPPVNAKADGDDSGIASRHGSIRAGGDPIMDGDLDDDQANQFEVFDEVITTFVAP